ncbi:GyrI-like domain-containing protein [Candidatus Bipolaricaulota bacterium]|nr:GyrI-like domain-containing protein [Candidatus Bipolaricaulota bacterium]
MGVTIKQIEPIHVLSVRRRFASQTEIVNEIQTLRTDVADILTGPPIALSLGFERDGKVDYELAFPVDEGIERSGFANKTLPLVSIFSLVHTGPLEGGEEGTNLGDVRVSVLFAFIREHMLVAGDPPERFVYHEGPETHGGKSAKYVTEIQYPYHMPIWLNALEEGARRVAGADAASRIMAGSETIRAGMDGRRVIDWIHGAIERLDHEIGAERDRARILNDCAHHYIVQSAETLKAAWEDCGHDLRKLVLTITEESLLGSKYWIDESGSQPLLMIERRPARQEAYDQAATRLEKKLAACYCPIARKAIQEAGETLSRTFCHCSGGWYVQEWENVFGTKPEVRLIASLLEEDVDACRFAVVIPAGFVKN